MSVSFVRVVVTMLSALSLAGCLRDNRAVRDRGAAGFESAPEVLAPLKDRCAAHGARMKAACEEAKYLAQIYVRKLDPGTDVCLESTFGEEPGGACQARAAVVDVGENRVLIEIRDAQPSSRWFNRIQHQIWFQEGALVDHYLAERGY